MLPEKCNYLNPTDLLDLCCSVVQFIRWIVDLLWQYNMVTIFELSLSFTEKVFLDQFDGMLCVLARS